MSQSTMYRKFEINIDMQKIQQEEVLLIYHLILHQIVLKVLNFKEVIKN